MCPCKPAARKQSFEWLSNSRDLQHAAAAAAADAAEVLERKAGDKRARGSWRCGGFSNLFNMSSVNTEVGGKQHY